MKNYYIQISSSHEGFGWWTVHKTQDKLLAEYMAEKLEIHENHYGQNNPGLLSVRFSRFMSEEELLNEDGVGAVRIAENHIVDGWDRVPTSSNEGPIENFIYSNLLMEVDILFKFYNEQSKAEI